MRKIFLVMIISFLFSAPSFAEKLKFVQITDSHLSLGDSDVKGRILSHSAENIALAVESLNQLKDLDFIFFSGDNIDVANEESLTINFLK